MKKMIRICLLLNLAFVFTLILALNSYAQSNQTVSSLEAGLGLSASGEYSNINISDIPGHTTIKTTIADPTKLGGCKVGDKVELSNLSWKTWAVKHIPTGKQFLFEVKKEDGNLKISKVISDNGKRLIAKHRFGIGLSAMHFDYEEDNGDFMEEDGSMYGVILDYTYHGDDGLMFKFSLEYAFDDDIEYEGSYSDGTSLKTDTDDWIVECRVLIGGDISNTSTKTIITPFIGIAYRYWNDDIRAIGGYEIETEYWYTPIGIKTVSPFFGNWTWGINAEYDLFWGGKVKSHLSDADSGFNNPEVDQDFRDGYGLRFSLQFERALTKWCALSIEPYIRYWDIDKSDTTSLTYEGAPTGRLVSKRKNETTTFGLCLRLVF
jgi:hypothetical protein